MPHNPWFVEAFHTLKSFWYWPLRRKHERPVLLRTGYDGNKSNKFIGSVATVNGSNGGPVELFLAGMWSWDGKILAASCPRWAGITVFLSTIAWQSSDS